MPTYQKDKIPTSNKGPKPFCTCGNCQVCKNRERQRRWREKHEERYAQLKLQETAESEEA